MSENSPCVKIAMATLRTGLNGERQYMASVALKRNMSFFFVIKTNVFKKKSISLIKYPF